MSFLRRPRSAAAAAFLLGVALTLLATVWQVNRNQAQAQQRFEPLANRTVAQVAERMRTYEYGLRGARGTVLASDGLALRRQAFLDYSASRDVDTEFPGARGFGVIWRVMPSEEADFVARAREDGWPDFEVRQLGPHTGERFVILYIEPVERNRAAVGLDIASEENRRTAAIVSMRTGAATLTEPITLVQATGKPMQSFLVMLPIYDPDRSLSGPDDREAAAIGWAYAPLVIDEILGGLDLSRGELTLALRDVDGADTQDFFTSTAHDPGLTNGLTREISFSVFGRTWAAEVSATPAFVAGLHQVDPVHVALLGAGFALLFAALAYLFAQGDLHSREVRIEQSRRSAMVEGSADAIIGESIEGIVTDWNSGAQRLFGYSAEEALGCPTASLVLPEGREEENARICGAIAEGRSVAPFDTIRRHRDGTLIDVSVAASPIISPDGRCVGYSKTVRDISEARRAQQALADLNASLERQVEERTARLDAALHDLRTILDAVPSMIGYWDRRLTNRVANRAYASFLGLTPAELRGRSLRELVGEEMYAHILPHVTAALDGEPQTFERAVNSPDEQDTRHFLAHYLPDVVDGEVCGFYVLIHDVTELAASRLQLAAAERDNAALLQTIVQHAIVSVADSRGRIIEVNDSFCELSGYTREELVGQDHRIVNSGWHDRAFWLTMWRDICQGRSWRGEVCNRAKDGSLYWVDSIIAPFVGDDGRIEKFISIRTNITARKAAEDRLRATSSLLGTVLASASEVSIIATDPDLLITVFNAGAEQLLGYSSEEVVGQTTPVLIHDLGEIEARAEELSEELGVPVEGGAVFTEPSTLGEPREWTYVRKDGSRVAVSLVITAMRGEEGELFGYLGIAHDVSRQKEHERSLRKAMHRARQANRAKSQFLANMSHEIRSPLNAVIGLSYLLGRTQLDAEQTGFVGKITLAGNSLLATINDILDLSKIEAAELRLERAPFHLETLLRELSTLMRVQSDAKGIRFDLELPAELPDALVGDAVRLNQILTNLLSNAIKFTDRGSVGLRVTRLGATEGAARFRFTVTDTGIGISEDALGRLFNPFAQADASTTRRFGGTGLGLSIVKQLVTLMEGKIGVTSTPGVGSEFWADLEFPLSSDSPIPALPERRLLPSTRELVGARILVADDSAVNLEVARRILELEGATVRFASNGQEAVDQLSADPHGIDLVLMDVQMPVLDGYDATRRIRQIPGLEQLPIIALTAATLTEELDQAEAAGMNGLVTKPFDPEDLIRRIRGLVSLSDPALEDPAPEDPALEDPAPEDLAPEAPALKDPHPGRVPEVPADWPEIDGIDARDASLRLRGDVDLFRSMLQKLLTEFADVEDDAAIAASSAPESFVLTGVVSDEPAATADSGDLAELGSRLHRLKGSSATLGAKALAELASRGEAACRAGDRESALLLQEQVAQQLHSLRKAAAGALELLLVPSDEDGEFEGEGPEPGELADLVQLLREADLAAIDQFVALTPPLKRLLGRDSFGRLRTQIDNLQFSDAARLIDQLDR